ncbi:hypothetical protein JR316_0007665 [Psilocybe cubensis]|uniref:Uncharacterized protein n=2 Tax=Psilocybe cubensis TaxID=181762 RepID=A0ACB8GU32_PSICU|nr:hypothetical protein JR316_0007665 [Psilocybe cubensis]KAH9479086.1 hypothetical protein JR316_0007665 [Psilocybe cubensis]
MPVGDQSAEEHYHCYLASQRRVERWVQRTDKELRAAMAGSAVQMPGAKGKAVVRSEEKRSQDVQLGDKDLVPAEPPREEVLPQRERHHEEHSRPSRRRSERTLSTPSNKRPTSSEELLQHSRSRSRPSSGSKKTKTSHVSGGRSSQPHPTKSSARHGYGHSHTHHRRESVYSNPDITLSSYLPYGVLPLLYAITGSPALSIVAAIILLALYLYVDFGTPATKKKSSSSSS